MISGFNTDVEYNGTMYHVQTEDKGLSKRVIMSLVYDRGTILASKRVSYDDMARESFDEKELADRVSRQHKLISAAVKAGRMDELKKMTAKSPLAAARVTGESIPAVVDVAGAMSPMPPSPASGFETAVPKPPMGMLVVETPVVETEVIAYSAPPELFEGEPVIDAVDIIEENEILPADAVEVVSELSGQERPTHTKLSLELIGEAKFKGGDRRTVNIMVCRGTQRKVVPDAQIMIKVLGSSFRPVIFHAKSDSNGLAKVHLQLPHFQAGRAALLVRAISGGEEIELRKVVTPG